MGEARTRNLSLDRDRWGFRNVSRYKFLVLGRGKVLRATPTIAFQIYSNHVPIPIFPNLAENELIQFQHSKFYLFYRLLYDYSHVNKLTMRYKMKKEFK